MSAGDTIGTFILGKNSAGSVAWGFGTHSSHDREGILPASVRCESPPYGGCQARVNFIDTADSYGPEHTENLIREALHPYHDVVIATKGGFKHPSEDVYGVHDGRPEHLRTALEGKLNGCKLTASTYTNCMSLTQMSRMWCRLGHFETCKQRAKSGISACRTSRSTN